MTEDTSIPFINPGLFGFIGSTETVSPPDAANAESGQSSITEANITLKNKRSFIEKPLFIVIYFYYNTKKEVVNRKSRTNHSVRLLTA